MSKMPFSGKTLTFASIFAGFFLLTLVFILADADRRVERVLFFPDEEGQEMLGELRRLPLRDSLEGNVELYVEELLLGPVGIELYRLFPKETDLESIVMKDRTLYLGFSEDLVTAAESVPLSFSGIIDAVSNAVVFNFPEVKEVMVAVGGEPVVQDVSEFEKK